MLEVETKSWQLPIAKGMGGVICAIQQALCFLLLVVLQIYGNKHFSC